jgi:ribA/ribD-fused uncharacterized protein
MTVTDIAVYFYSDKGKFGCFSNFFWCDFTVDSVQYWCTEQYIMKMKQELFDSSNYQLADTIMASQSAVEIKGCGRSVRYFDERVWKVERVNVAHKGLYAKFKQNETIKAILLNTEEKTLYEAAKNDKIWGIGFDSLNGPKVDPSRYGQNILGLALMEVRGILRGEM